VRGGCRVTHNAAGIRGSLIRQAQNRLEGYMGKALPPMGTLELEGIGED
jgi:hypothetical protein